MTDPFIIMCAPNGARRGKSDHANIPLTPTEIADCAEEVLAAGASILHLHVRDEAGGHSLSVRRYQDAISAVRARVGDKLVIQATSEAVGRYSRDQQMEMVKLLKPEAVSLALREICPGPADEASTTAFFSWIEASRIFPQIILYDEKDVGKFEYLRQQGVFCQQRPFVLCVLGKYGSSNGETLSDLQQFADVLSPVQVPWAACSFGAAEHGLAAKTLQYGGHVRVGFENNLHRRDGGLADNNAELVAGAYSVARDAGYSAATADDVRQMLMQR